MKTSGNPPQWVSEGSLLTIDRHGEFTDREILAGHEAGHATVAWFMQTWPHVALNGNSGGGKTLRLAARNDHESIAIVMAGIEADRLQRIELVKVQFAQLQDWSNLRVRYPSPTIAETTPARELARGTLLKSRNEWWQIREQLLVTDHVDWREITSLVTGEEPRLICARCGRAFEVDDPSYMTRDMDGQPVCSLCASRMLPGERLALARG